MSDHVVVVKEKASRIALTVPSVTVDTNLLLWLGATSSIRLTTVTLIGGA
jgi:hypothetical protein